MWGTCILNIRSVVHVFFLQKGTLKIHMQNHTGEKPIYVSSAERGFQSVLCWRNIYRPILESLCIFYERGVDYSKSSKLMKHISKHRVKPPYPRRVWNLIFTDRVFAEYDDRNKAKPLSRCEELFSFKDNFQWHLWTLTGEKLYICQECGVGLLHHTFLQIHIKTTEEKPLEIIGNKQFGSKTNWNINLSW